MPATAPPGTPGSTAPLRLGRHSYERTDRLVMAVINRTPDSFFDKGATYAMAEALEAADRAVAEGAAILDIGGVKAGPGAEVDTAEELRRTASFVAEARARHPDVVISVDTWRSEVGRVVVGEGADLLNDAWGGVDPGLAEVAADARVGLVCTHAGGLAPRTRPHRVRYPDVVADVISRTTALAERAVRLGVPADAIMIDPGHDFGKNTFHSLEATRRLDEVVATGWPVLVSLSRKDFIGEVIGLPPDQRLEGTLAATAISAWLGAQVYRAHDVAATRRVLDVVSAVAGTLNPPYARRGLA